MIKVNRLLCPTDLSSESAEALRYAVALARAYGAQLFLLHCSEAESLPEDKDGRNFEHQWDRLFTPSLAPHLGLATMNELNWHGLVRTPVHNVGEAIVREAVVQDVDLIVMRSRHRPRAAVLLGSTAESVCRNAPCPVLVTHPAVRATNALPPGIPAPTIVHQIDFPVTGRVPHRRVDAGSRTENH